MAVFVSVFVFISFYFIFVVVVVVGGGGGGGVACCTLFNQVFVSQRHLLRSFSYGSA